MPKSSTSTFDKLKKLMGLYDDILEELDLLKFDVEERDSDEAGESLYKVIQREKKIRQKLRKQMANFLKETN